MSRILYIKCNCNQKCVFCLGLHENNLVGNQKILSEARKGERIVISGGETTLSRDLLKILHLAKDKGLTNIELQSNGETLAEAGFARDLMKAGVKEFNINMPSHLERLNDRITQTPGSFKKTIKGLQNLINLKARIRLTCIIHSLNYATLEDYYRFVRVNLKGIAIVVMNFIQVEGGAKENPGLVPRFNQIKPFLLRTCEYARAVKGNFLTDNVPLCIFDKRHFYFCVDYNKNMLLRQHKKTDQTLNLAKAFTVKCRICLYQKLCGGVRTDYLQLYGDKELIPICS